MKDNQKEKNHFKIMDIDPYLKPFESDIELRMKCYTTCKNKLLDTDQSLESFASGDLFYGFHLVQEIGRASCRERVS